MIIFSSIIWLIEKPGGSMVSDDLLIATGRDGPSETSMQAICFGTIPSAFWWALTTMTTVGYGDCYPITWVGKVVSTFAMVGGVIVLALPITVLGSNFAKMVEMYEEDASNLALADLSDDGLVDDLELREFLTAKKKEGLLKKEVEINGVPRPLTVALLMGHYDSEEQGALTKEDFKRLQADVLDNKAFDQAQEFLMVKAMLLEHQTLLNDLEDKIDSLCKHQGIEVTPAMSERTYSGLLAEASMVPMKEASARMPRVNEAASE